MTGRLFILGLGYSGLEIAKLAQAAGWEVAGTVRDPEKAKQYTAEGLPTHLFDSTAPLPAPALAGVSHVLCTIAPGASGDPALGQCAPLLRGIRWLGYLSTVGVYGDRGGEWVDETATPAPRQARSQWRLAAEHAWQAIGSEVGAAVDIFRLPGIYGPGRSALDQVMSGKARRIDKPGQVFSRIHVADIATTVLAAMTKPSAGSIYNVADDLPAPTSDVIAYACELLALPVPPLVPWEQIAPTMSEMGRSFYSESRRVRNRRIKQELGVQLCYRTYREGLNAIARAD